MKGTLHKTKDNWMVKYTTYKTLPGVRGIMGSHSKIPNHNHLPLHPDDCKRFNTNGDSQSCVVEFDIVEIITPVEDGTTMYKCAKILTKCYCGHTTYCDCGPLEEDLLKDWDVTLNDGEPLLDHIANEAFKSVGDEGLFPNHTDKDIWINGFKAGYLADKKD